MYSILRIVDKGIRVGIYGLKPCNSCPIVIIDTLLDTLIFILLDICTA